MTLKISALFPFRIHVLVIIVVTAVVGSAFSLHAALFVNHNLNAVQAHMDLQRTNTRLAESFTLISSGLRTIRAGDDAAGLAVSERLQARIRSLEQAQRNTSDAISMMDTAETALDEVSIILIRMQELTDQSTNGTYTTSDRSAMMDAELQAKAFEITRIANTTTFNGIALLDESDVSISTQVGAGDTQEVDTIDLGTFVLRLQDIASGINSAVIIFQGSHNAAALRQQIYQSTQHVKTTRNEMIRTAQKIASHGQKVAAKAMKEAKKADHPKKSLKSIFKGKIQKSTKSSSAASAGKRR